MENPLSIAAGIVAFAGCVPYALAILLRGARPIRSTWIVWLLIDLVTFGGMLAAKEFSWLMVGVIAGTAIITALALWRGLPGWTLLDKDCLEVGGLSVALILFAGSPLVGIVASLSAVVMAASPTFISAYADHRRESRVSWAMAPISSVLSLCAVEKWRPEAVAAPLTYLSVQSAMIFLIIVRPALIRRRA